MKPVYAQCDIPIPGKYKTTEVINIADRTCGTLWELPDFPRETIEYLPVSFLLKFDSNKILEGYGYFME